MRNIEVLEDLIGYLEARRPYLPDYEARQRAGLWIASNRVEKFNDWSVSARCKHRGMEWTEPGVVSLAVLGLAAGVSTIVALPIGLKRPGGLSSTGA